MSQRSVCFCFLFVKGTDSYLEHPMQQVFQPSLSFFPWFIGLLNIILVCSFHSNCGKVALLHFFSLSTFIFLEPTRMVLGGLSKCQSVYCTKKNEKKKKKQQHKQSWVLSRCYLQGSIDLGAGQIYSSSTFAIGVSWQGMVIILF